MKSNYKKLWQFIEEVNIRNKDLTESNLLWISIKKIFIPSIANTIWTDMSSYKIVKKWQFAYWTVTSRNGDKISIALLENNDSAIVSQAYKAFEIVDENELLPEYLMMWFRRPEFDRYARFMSHGSTREVFDRYEMCNTEIPVPDITKQQEIVDEYNVIKDRILLNNDLIGKLEDTAQAIYKEWFVDFEFPDEKWKPYKSSGGEMEYCEELEKDVPKGWRMKKLENFCDLITAWGTPKRDIHQYWNKNEVLWIKNWEIKNNIIFRSNEFISKEWLNNSSAKLLPKNTVLVAMYCVSDIQVSYLVEEASTNQACCWLHIYNKVKSAYLYYTIKYSWESLVSFANWSAQVNLSKDIISSYSILIPKDNLLNNSVFRENIEYKERITREQFSLDKIKELLLSRMANF